LSYLRAGSRNKKKKKDKLGSYQTTGTDLDLKMAAAAGKKGDDLPLYDDIGDYVPTLVTVVLAGDTDGELFQSPAINLPQADFKESPNSLN
jgi:hypothetical protein